MALFKNNEPIMGFDLSDISIKIMHFENKGGNYEVLGFADHVLPKGIMVNDIIKEEALLRKHIAALLKKPDYGKINARKIVASIPESKAFVRVIQIPKMSEEQAALAVPAEAEQYIPLPLDQTKLDWQIISASARASAPSSASASESAPESTSASASAPGEKMDVLVTASPKNYIDNFLEILKSAGLRPVAFEVESAAVLRALLSPQNRSKDFMILDMDTYRTSLIIASNGNLEYTSSVPIAGDAFTQSIARVLGISAEEAEKVKRETGLEDSSENSQAKAALAPVVDNLISEIRNTIRFHEEHAANKIEEIILAGGSAKLKNLAPYLREQFAADRPEMDVRLGNPWVNVLQPEKTPSIMDSLSYTTAIGLAIRAADM